MGRIREFIHVQYLTQTRHMVKAQDIPVTAVIIVCAACGKGEMGRDQYGLS